MTQKHWLLVVIIGFSIGALVAGVVTFFDWQLNPDGVFHSEAGTNWVFVWDTWFSWFAPLFVVAAGLCAFILFLFARQR